MNTDRQKIYPVPAKGFDIQDVRIIPRIEKISYKDAKVTTKITNNIKIDIPFIASPMDTVLGIELAEKLLTCGSVPIFYVSKRNAENVIDYLNKLSLNENATVGICIAPDIDFIFQMIKKLNNVRLIAIDSLHSMPYNHLKAVEYINKNFKEIDIISGNITNAKDAMQLINCGVNAVRVGMTNNSVNDGEVLFGCGRKQGSALLECYNAIHKYEIPIISDGGNNCATDMALAIALGADCVMLGKMFAAMRESAAESYEYGKDLYKLYKGMSRRDIIDEDMMVESLPRFIKVSGNFNDEVNRWLDIIKVAIVRSGEENICGLRDNSILELIH